MPSAFSRPSNGSRAAGAGSSTQNIWSLLVPCSLARGSCHFDAGKTLEMGPIERVHAPHAVGEHRGSKLGVEPARRGQSVYSYQGQPTRNDIDGHGEQDKIG